MMNLQHLHDAATSLLSEARHQGIKIATAESCTGGLIASLLTDIPGSSDVFDRGYVTYSNQSKTDMLGVPRELLNLHGAVSESIAKSMAEEVLEHSDAQLSVSVTGIAGPGGGSDLKPVGLVHMATAKRGEDPKTACFHFTGDRQMVRMQAVEAAINMLRERIK